MKTRLLWIAIAAVGLAALYFGIARPNASTIPSQISDPIVDLKPTVPPMEPPEVVIPAIPMVQPPPMKSLPRRPATSNGLEVPIQNGATIDFSTGAPVVKMQGKDQDALEAALKEMAEVANGTSVEAKK